MSFFLQSKKATVLAILEILKNHTDFDHPMLQKEIIEKLNSAEYDMNVERKSVKRDLMLVEAVDEHVKCKRKKRTVYNKKTRENEESELTTGFYYIHDFEESEVHMLTDTIVFSKHIPKEQKKDLIERLEKLTSSYYKSTSKNIHVSNGSTSQNKSWLLNIEQLNKAINNHNAVSFNYNDYGIDKKLHVLTHVETNPYQIVAANNHYFLVGENISSNGFEHYRIDKITELQVLEEEFFEPQLSFDMDAYLSSHIYMSSGEAEYIYINVDVDEIGAVIDYFGDNFIVIDSDDDIVKIRVKSNEDDIYYWALQYGNHVEITEPQTLRNRIRNTVESMARTYLETNEDKYSRAIDTARIKKYIIFRNLDLRNKNLDEIPSDILSLRMSYTKNIKSYDFVMRLTNLERISISHQIINDFSFINGIKNLKSLELYKTGFKDLSVIKNLGQIEELRLVENDDVQNLNLIFEMPKLNYLLLSENLLKKIDIEELKKINSNLTVKCF